MQTVADIALYTVVQEALENALDNGYPVDKWTAEYTAADLAQYCADLEQYGVEQIQPHVEMWLSTIRHA